MEKPRIPNPSPPDAMTQPRKLNQAKREAIIEAAIHEFHTHGFPATSMDRIAATAGVSKRTIYNHFADKDALFSAISSCACERIVEQSAMPYDPKKSLDSQLLKLAHSKLELLGSKDFLRLVRVTVAEKIRRPRVVEEAFEEISRGEFGATLWIRAAVADGRLAVPDPVAASSQFSALLKEFALWPQLFGTAPPLTKRQRNLVAKRTVAMFLDHYAC